MWSAGADTVYVWSCNDIGEAPVAKEGEMLVHHKATLREVWKKQYFVLDPETRTLSLYDGASKKKKLGDIELLAANAPLRDGSSSGLADKSPRVGKQSSSKGSLSRVDTGTGVRIENIVTHKRQFKIHSGSKTYILKTTADTNDKNGKNVWMGAILATIPKVVVAIKSIQMPSPIMSLVRFGSKDEKSDSVLIQRQHDIHIINEQSFTQLAPFQFEKSNHPLTCICAMHPFILGARDREINFYNTMTQQQTVGSTFVATGEITCMNSAAALTLIVIAGTKQGKINVWRGASVRGGSKEVPHLVLDPPLPSLRTITILNNRLLWCYGEEPTVAEYSLDLEFFAAMQGGERENNIKANQIQTTLQCAPLDLSITLAMKKAFLLGANGDTVYFDLM